VSFHPEIRFGNELLCRGARATLFDTLRTRAGETKIEEQKMVDTSLVSDLLYYARASLPNASRKSKVLEAALVIADDDDVLPGAITAEAWGANVRVSRVKRETECRHLLTKGLVLGECS
jgi:hypothetical protein